MYLTDTNIWLEYLLKQDKHDEVKKFINFANANEIYLTDFSFFSIAIIMCKNNLLNEFKEFCNDIFETDKVKRLSLEIVDIEKVLKNIKNYKIDFDDSYQLTVAQKFNLILLSYDKDFDSTPIKRIVPGDII